VPDISKQKVALFIDSTDSGGAENIVLALARFLQKEGISVEILHFQNAWIGEAADEQSIPHFTLSDTHFKKTYRLPLFARYMAKVIRDKQITVLHSHLYGAIVGGALAAKLAGVRHIGTVHDRYSLLDSKSRIPLLRIASMLGTVLIAVSYDIQKTIQSLSSFGWKHLYVVHNGVEIDDIGRVADQDHQRFPDDPVRLVFVGRLVQLKRVDLLIDAVAMLNVKPNFFLQIVGDGPLKIDLQDQVSARGLDHQIEITGFRNDVANILRNSDCFILPSDTEGLSCSIMEAMVAGIPTIACDVGGNSELIQHGVSGWLIPPNSRDALCQALEKVICSANTRREAGTQARLRVEEKFSLQKMTSEYSTYYFK